MSLHNLSIRDVIFLVVLVACDLVALRLIGRYALVGLLFGLFSVLPTSNIFVMALYRAWTRRAPGRPFLVGFGLAGALATLIWFDGLLMVDERQLAEVVRWYHTLVERNGGAYIMNPMIRTAISIVITFMILVSLGILPQMLVALVGGRIARRYAGALDLTSSDASPPR